MKVRIPLGNWVYHWHMKEYGSWEDHNLNPSHPAAILAKQGRLLDLTLEEIKRLIESGKYQSTAWNEDEIIGGAQTMAAIAKFTKRLESLV